MEVSESMAVMDRELDNSPSKSQPDVKKFIGKIGNGLGNIQNLLHQSKQEYNLIRSESQALENKNKETCNDIMNKVLDDLERLNKDFKKMVNEEKHENVFLRQQMGTLTQDKVKLEQNALLLNTRVVEVETQLGTEIELPDIDSD